MSQLAPTKTLPYTGFGRVLSQASVAMSALGSRHCVRQLGITAAQAAAIHLIATRCAVTASDLAREYGIDASAAMRMVGRLEK